MKIVYNGKEIELAEPKPPTLRLGDLAEKLAKPIARALRLPCLDAQGNLNPESGCAKRKARLNAI